MLGAAQRRLQTGGRAPVPSAVLIKKRIRCDRSLVYFTDPRRERTHDAKNYCTPALCALCVALWPSRDCRAAAALLLEHRCDCSSAPSSSSSFLFS